MKILLLCALLLLVGCSSVSNEGVERAIQACQDHEGVMDIKPNVGNDPKPVVTCNDGIVIITDGAKK